MNNTKKIFISLTILLVFSTTFASAINPSLDSNVHYKKHIDVPIFHGTWFRYIANSTNNIVHLTVNGSHAFNFVLYHEMNSSNYILNSSNSQVENVYKIQNKTSFSIDYTLISNGTFYFEFASTDIFSLLGINVDIIINLPPNTQIQSILGFFPVIVVVFVIGLGLLLLITKFRLKRSKVVEYQDNKLIHEPTTPVIEVANKKIPSEVLQKYWFCPTDHDRLQLVTSKVAGNPSFIVLKERIKIGINNAISLRKIPFETEDQTIALAKEIFSQFDLDEISLVNTRCPTCQKYYSVPQI